MVHFMIRRSKRRERFFVGSKESMDTCATYATLANAGGIPQYIMAPAQPSRGRGGCIALVLIVVFVCIAMWMCSTRSPKVYGAGPREDLRCGVPTSGIDERAAENVARMTPEQLRRRATQTYINAAQPNAGTGINNSIGRAVSTPNVGLPLADEVTPAGKALSASAPYLDDSFAPSQATAEFYQTFNPISLSSLMPANWRPTGKNCGAVAPASAAQAAGTAPADTRFDEFSRYTIAPDQVQRAETMRGTIRLSELTNTRNSRTLGMPSLLRNYVTPTGPTPIGNDAMLWNDSQQRQGYIAAATGRYPDQIGC